MIKDSGREVLRINHDGNVGMGTTTPAQKLDISSMKIDRADQGHHLTIEQYRFVMTKSESEVEDLPKIKYRKIEDIVL